MAGREEYNFHKSAQDLINQFSVVIRTAHIHDTNNIAVTLAVDKLVKDYKYPDPPGEQY